MLAARRQESARGTLVRAQRVATLQSGQLAQVQGQLRRKAETLGVAERTPSTTLVRPGQRDRDLDERGR